MSDLPIPATPAFEAEMESALRSAMPPAGVRRLPVRTTALRAIREMSRGAMHAAAAVGIATVLVLVGGARDVASEPAPLTVSEGPGLPMAYVRQFSDADTAIRQALAAGFEVQVRRTFVADRAADGRVLSVTHAGSEIDGLPANDEPHAPIVIEIGFAVADGRAVAT